ncbi:MAG: DegT/DnrJ/EryC1/StrS family aminotransferase [Pseudomonadota bacterium]
MTDAVRLAGRVPVSPTPPHSLMLGPDDVEVALRLLGDPQGWGGDSGAVRAFEAEFAAWNGSGHCHAFIGARAALSACIEALELEPGDEVILPGYTCIVVPNALRFAGIVPVFADIELDTYGLDFEALKRKIGEKTRAIIVHHLYGLVSRDLLKIIDLARDAGIPVIEDCAQSAGAGLGGIRVGNFGDVSIFSTEQSKVFTTITGGLAVTNDPAIARGLARAQEGAAAPPPGKVRALLESVVYNYFSFNDPGRWWKGDLLRLGFGMDVYRTTTDLELRMQRPPGYMQRMPSALAEIGLGQLKKLDGINARRVETARVWDDWCGANGYAKPCVIPDSTPIFLRYPLLVPPALKRDPSWARRELGIELGVWFTGNQHPVHVPLPDCPNGAYAVERCVNFPGLVD